MHDRIKAWHVLLSFVVLTAAAPLSVYGKDSRLYVAGFNYQGQLGLPDVTSLATFTQVPDLTAVCGISAGGMWSMVVTGDGRLWASGLNSEGQLGLGDQTSRTTFTPLSSPTDVVTVKAGGNHTLALDEDGHVWSTGYNYYGGLGLGDNSRRTSFQMVPGIADVEGIAALAYSSVAWKEDGSIYSTGFNSQGELGQGDYTHRYTFSMINFPQASAGTRIAAGGSHFLACMDDGAVFVAGANSMGQLGLGDTTLRNSLTQVPTVADTTDVSGGWVDSLLVKDDGTVMATGRNSSGELGLGDTIDRNTFTAVPGVTEAQAAAAGSSHSLILKDDGTLWSAGAGASLGLPKAKKAITKFTLVPNLEHVTAIAAGSQHSMAIALYGVDATYPSAAGITLDRGQTCRITWNSYNLPKGSAVKIELVKGGSETWLLAAAAKKSPFKWTVGKMPDGSTVYPDGTDYKIRLSLLDGSDIDESDNDFGIGSIASLSINGTTLVADGDSAQYTCTAHYNIGSVRDITAAIKWSCTKIDGVKMGKTGLLTTGAVSSDLACRITAEYKKVKPSLTATHDITILSTP